MARPNAGGAKIRFGSLRVGPKQSTAPPDVRFTSNSVRISAAERGSLGVWSEFERELIRERTIAGLSSARARGPLWRPALYHDTPKRNGRKGWGFITGDDGRTYYVSANSKEPSCNARPDHTFGSPNLVLTMELSHRRNSSTRVALPTCGSSKLASGGEQQPEELHDEEDFRHRSVCHVANGWRDRCAGPIQQGPDAGYRHGGEPPKDPVRRLPTFIQTPTARSTCIGSPAPRCALGAAPGGQHAATRSEHPSTADEPAIPTQCVSRADCSDILARCRR